MRPNKRDELVSKALDVFYRSGFHATGMDTLVKETGISKTSIYKHFRTKDDLIIAVLRLRDENFRSWLFSRMAALSDAPAGQLLAMFTALGEWFGKPEFAGCMFIKASAEFQNRAHPVYQQSTEHKQMLLEHFTGLAKAAGASDPAGLARQLLTLKEGAIVLAAMSVTPDPAGDARHTARMLLQPYLAEG
ncbi:TetR/AcrR family transcriptional regulator [Leisingera aquaemixtae]|uniref:TetR/AcrR family transcriptional regulator n=1 Tax=Leisingera aquaemixtae TaxID=1396826 RepID=A0ABY5WGB7_9RHOB|nr:TetR/AcrR family transcriptional regulator [Leisingera aquaemixtae]UWQ40496.1 TetR/AcrR family transcriptional regulator [Leisingera aquaemixtae]UWQ44751.1 TetR/AcrR family transcriptional regulator [Leisingera aquaemixtae]